MFDSELDRAKWVIEKAEREGLDIVDALVTHMVSKTLIVKLTGIEPNLERKARKNKDKVLSEWVSTHIGTEVTVPQLASDLGVSAATANKLVKNVDYFTRSRRGFYSVRDGVAEREAVKSIRKN
jgi:hypothetical protein